MNHAKKNRPRRVLQGIALGLSLALVAAACGGDDAPADEPAAEEPDDDADDDADDADDDADDADDAADADFDEEEVRAHFEGETINFIVGFGPGGAYDTHARILAEYMPQYIPGEPDIVIQNIPGGVSLNGAREMSLAQPDGRTIAVYSSNLNFQHLVGVDIPGFDPTEVIQLGTALNWWGSIPMWCVRDDVATSFDELLELDRNVRWAQPSLFPAAAFMDLTDLPFENVLGYDGMASVVQAVESSETDGTGWCTTETLDTLAPQWLDDGTVTPLFYAHDLDMLDGEPNADWHERSGVEVMPQLKELYDLTDEQEAILQLVSLEQFTSTQNIAAPNGTPDHIVAALREAIRLAAEDPEFQQAMVDADRVPGYRSPEEILAGEEEVLSYPQEVRDAVRGMFEE